MFHCPSLAFSSHFEDVFEIRRMSREEQGKLHAPAWKRGALFYRYDGRDGVIRTVGISFSKTPSIIWQQSPICR